MNGNKGRGRPPGVRKGEANFSPYWREIEQKAAEMGVSVARLFELVGFGSPPNYPNYRHGIPAAAATFLALMSERSCTLEELVATGITAPPAARHIAAIRALQPAVSPQQPQP